MATVSVIVPVFNGKKHLEETLESILKQEVDLEIIVVDDGSTDGSPEVVQSLNDKRIKLIEQKNSGSPAHPRNVGIRAAKGSLVALCDQDDIWYADKLKAQVGAYEKSISKNKIGIIVSSADLINKKGKIIGRNQLDFEGYLACEQAFGRLVLANFITACSALIPKKIYDEFGGFDESLAGVDEYDLWLKITRKYGVLGVKETLCAWRSGADALSSDKVKLYEEDEKIFERLEQELSSDLIRQGHGKNLMRIIAASILVKDYRTADKYVAKTALYPVSANGERIIAIYKKNRKLGYLLVRSLKLAGKVSL